MNQIFAHGRVEHQKTFDVECSILAGLLSVNVGANSRKKKVGKDGREKTRALLVLSEETRADVSKFLEQVPMPVLGGADAGADSAKTDAASRHSFKHFFHRHQLTN